jgi:hypothetical protein
MGKSRAGFELLETTGIEREEKVMQCASESVLGDTRERHVFHDSIKGGTIYQQKVERSITHERFAFS